VIVTLGNFATRFILQEQIGIARARGQKYSRLGATVVPTFHPAAALRGGRFGGLSPIDALRMDFQVVKTLLSEPSVPLDETPEREPGTVRPDETPEREPDSAQLGLF